MFRTKELVEQQISGFAREIVPVLDLRTE